MEEAGGVPRSSQALSSVEFAALYPRLRQFAAVVADQDIDPDDVVQEALTAYLRRFGRDGRADEPEAYLKTAIVGIVSNQRRSLARRRRRESVRDDDAYSPAYPSDVSSLLAGLSPSDRALLVLVEVEGEQIASAATIVGLSSVAARARLSRARRKIRDDLNRGDRDA